MILLTASGSFAEAFKQTCACEVISARKLNDESLCRAVSNAAVVIHNGALIDATDDDSAISNNFDQTRRVMDAVAEFNPSARFIFLSSMSILHNDTEYLPPIEMTSYALSKYFSEIYCLRSAHQNKVIVRFSTIFYGNHTKDGLSKLVYDSVTKNQIEVYDGGRAERDFLPLMVASKYVKKLTEANRPPSPCNLVSGRATSFSHIVQILTTRFPTLRVVEKGKIDSMPVFARFSDRDVQALGIVEFSIEDEILRYAKTISAIQ